MIKRILWTLLMAAIFPLFSIEARQKLHAEEWEGSLHLGFTGSSGNSRTNNSHLSVNAESKGTRLTSRYSGSMAYGRTEGKKTSDKSVASAQYDFKIRKEVSTYVTSTWERNEIAELDWRMTLGPGVGFPVIDGRSLKLRGELGLSYFRQKYENQEIEDYFSLRVAQRGVWKINQKAKIWESTEYAPSIKDYREQYILKYEAGIEDSVASKISIRFLVQNTYNSHPPEGTEKNDTSYIAAVGYQF